MATALYHVVMVMPVHWAETLGGAEYQAQILARHLSESGRYRVTWLCRWGREGPHPEALQVVARHGGLRSRGYFFDAVRLTRLLEELAPDVIYQRVACAYTGISARYARRSGCRMVWHVSSDDDVTPVARWRAKDYLLPHRRLENWMTEYGIRRAPEIVVQTRRQAELLEANYGRRAAAIVRNFHPLPKETIDKGGPLTVAWIANLKPLKQPDLFVQLAETFAGQDVRFVMVGVPSPDRDAMAALEGRMARLPNFSYLGRRSQDEVNELLAKSHVLVNTSLFEGFSNTFIQAWMRGVPVLSLNADPDGLLAEGGLGYCAAGDFAGLEGELRKWITEPEALSAMAQSGREYALAEHSESNIGRLVALLEEP